MSKDRQKEILNIFLAVATLVFGFLSFFTNDYSDWVRYAAAGASVFVFIVLAAFNFRGVVEWVGEKLRSKRVSKEQRNRLQVLINDASNHMSYSYAHSPFYVWHSASNAHSGQIGMNQAYHGAIVAWISDLKALYEEERGKNVNRLMRSLEVAISQAARCAEQAERELCAIIQNKALSDSERKRLAREWDSAKNHYNQWLDRWRVLFDEISAGKGEAGKYYVRPLEMIG